MTTTEASAALSIRAGNTLLLDARLLERNHCLTVHSGLVRVSASRPEQEALAAQPVTLGFLQAGDQLPLDLLRTTRLHLEALTAAQLVEGCPMEPAAGTINLHEWTLSLLLLRNLNDAGQRIGALLQLLVERLGRRNGAWYELPLRLTHAELADLSGHTRVTVTKQLSRWRSLGLIEQDAGPARTLRISPELLEA
ncbi:MAG: helix-turn-helix domain-containing protein [Cyanobium sp.]|jgi:CRP-like cAMP-binding protein